MDEEAWRIMTRVLLKDGKVKIIECETIKENEAPKNRFLTNELVAFGRIICRGEK